MSAWDERQKYFTDGSICHLKFPKVVLTHILGEVGTLCIFLVSVYSRTGLPIFIEIDSHVTDTEQKYVVTFLRYGVLQTTCEYSKSDIAVLNRNQHTTTGTRYP